MLFLHLLFFEHKSSSGFKRNVHESIYFDDGTYYQIKGLSDSKSVSLTFDPPSTPCSIFFVNKYQINVTFNSDTRTNPYGISFMNNGGKTFSISVEENGSDVGVFLVEGYNDYLISNALGEIDIASFKDSTEILDGVYEIVFVYVPTSSVILNFNERTDGSFSKSKVINGVTYPRVAEGCSDITGCNASEKPSIYKLQLLRKTRYKVYATVLSTVDPDYINSLNYRVKLSSEGFIEGSMLSDIYDPVPYGLKSKQIAWILVGVLICVVVIAGLVWYFVFHRRKDKTPEPQHDIETQDINVNVRNGEPDADYNNTRRVVNSPYEM